MRKKTLLWLMGYTGGLGTSFVKGPIIALVTYMYTFYTQFTSWAKGIEGRWSLYVSLTLLISYLMKKNSLPKLEHLKMPQFKWLFLILINMFLVTPFAADPAGNKATIIEYAKLMLLYYLIVHIVRTKEDYKLFIWAQIIGNFNFGWEAYTRGKIIAGRLENIGGPGVMGSNYLSNHLVMVLPFIAIFVLFGNRWEKIAGCISGVFVLNALVLCNSRGAFLGVGVMALVAFIMAKRWMWFKLIIGVVLAVVGFITVGGVDRVMSRMQTVESYEEDNSAMSRVRTWTAAVIMMKDYPLGRGGDGFKALSPVYVPEEVEMYGGKRTIHNTYLMMGTNWGIQGLTLYLIFLGATLLELCRIQKRKDTQDDNFYILEGWGILLAIISFLIAATFGNRIYAESLYWYAALATSLSNIQQSELVKN